MELAELALPNRKQEPYRYTDLESLYRTDFTSGSESGGAAAAATAEAVKPYLLEACQGQQMVFVNGLFSEELSDVSALGGVEGLVVGHVGEMEGATLEQVCCVGGRRERFRNCCKLVSYQSYTCRALKKKKYTQQKYDSVVVEGGTCIGGVRLESRPCIVWVLLLLFLSERGRGNGGREGRGVGGEGRRGYERVGEFSA